MSTTKKPVGSLGNNLSAAAAALGAEDTDAELPAAAAPGPTGGNPKSELEHQRAEKKVTIIVEENDHTPPNGHFVGVNGIGYQIQAGKEVTVPLSVLEVLDNAKEAIPITDAGQTVIGFRDRLRVPYRVVRYEA